MSEVKATNITWHEGSVSREERQKLLGQKGVTVWMTGLSAAGKSTIAVILELDPVLPWEARRPRRLAVIGRLADVPNTGDTGSSMVRSPSRGATT